MSEIEGAVRDDEIEGTIPEGTMRAAVLKDSDDLEVMDVDIPTPRGRQLLVEVKSNGLCGTDLEIYHPPKWEAAEFPYTLGHEWAGKVVAKGPEASAKFDIGDRVASEPHDGCGVCRNCRVGKYTSCLNYGNLDMNHYHWGFTVDGGMAEYAIIPESNVHHIPEDWSYGEGTLMTTAATSLYAIERAEMEAGDFVVVQGPGPIGLVTVWFAKQMGASEVMLTGTGTGNRLEVGEQLGADYTVNIREEDAIEVAKELTDGVGPDVVLECAGVPQAQTEAVDMVRRGGTVCLVGNHDTHDTPIDTQWIVVGDIDVVGSKAEGMNSGFRATRLMEHRDFPTELLLTHEYDLEDAVEALHAFEDRENGEIKVLVSTEPQLSD